VDGGRDEVLALVEPVAAELDLEVLDVEFSGNASRRVLRIYLDSSVEGRAATLADCEAVSRRVGDVLDAHEAVLGRYLLEVSSPGLDRPLRKPAHFERAVGQKVRLRLRAARDGSRSVIGRLERFEGGRLSVGTEDGGSVEVGLDEIEKANLRFEFETKKRPGAKRR